MSGAAEATARLNAAKEDPARRLLAHRLQLRVSEHLVQPETYRKSLDFLQDQRQDRLPDHIGYWQLLASIGRKAEALQLIDSHVTPPASGEETVLLAKAHFDLGQQERSRKIMEQYAPQYADSEAVWVTYSNLLTEQERWNDLIGVALLIRHEDNPLRDALASYSYYIEGVGELRRGRRPAAVEVFKRIPRTKVKNKVWELIIAEKLELLGFPDIAKDTLLSVQKDLPDDPNFWVLLGKTAFDSQDPDLLVSAMASAYKLRPNDPMIINNYAAALLSTRQRPEEAMKLTARLLEQLPDNPGRLINHSLALLQNRHVAEAETILRRIEAAKLTGADLTSYHYAWFELYFTQQHYDQARQANDKIERQYLLPTEKEWLESTLHKMKPAEPGGKA